MTMMRVLSDPYFVVKGQNPGFRPCKGKYGLGKTRITVQKMKFSILSFPFIIPISSCYIHCTKNEVFY